MHGRFDPTASPERGHQCVGDQLCGHLGLSGLQYSSKSMTARVATFFAAARNAFAAAPAFHGQPLLCIEPIELLVVRPRALARQQDAEAAVTKPAPLCRQLAQALAQRLVAALALRVLEGGSIQIR